MPIRKAKWETDTQFQTGGTVVFDNTEIVGTGQSAKIQLSQKANSDDNILYNDNTKYSKSDDTKVIVNENANGKASLKILTSSDYTFLYNNPSGFTFDTNKIEVTSVAALKDSKPTNATCHANYESDINLNWGDGVLTGTAYGGASVSSGFLDLSYGDYRSVFYNADLNADSQQTGCVRFIVKPNYNGAPGSDQVFWMVSNDIDNKNNLGVQHRSGGQLRILKRDKDGNGTSTDLGAWSPTLGVSYEIEFNWDFTTGALRLFVNGIQFGSTLTDTFTRDTNIDTMSIGDWYIQGTSISKFSIGYIIVFNAVQHTTNYTPGSSIPSTIYSIENPSIKSNSGFAFTSSLNIFTITSSETGSNALKYQVSIDNGTNFKWWNGSSWVTRTVGQTDDWYYTNESNTKTEISNNISSLASSGTFIPMVFLHSADGTQTPTITSVYVAESVTYSTDDNLYIDTTDNSQISPTDVISWLSATITSEIPTNTDIKIMFSNNGRSSWLTWNGSSWSAPSDSTLRSNATSLTDAVSNFSDISIGNATLDVRLFLYSSSNIVTPTVDNINVIGYGGYETSGYWRSINYKPENNTNGVYLQDIEFDVTIPGGTTLRVLVRNGEFIFEDGFTEYQNGDSINLCGDFIQLRVNFTSNGVSTPSFNYAYITFHTLIGVMRAIDDSITSLQSDITSLQSDIDSLQSDITLVKKIETKRWKIVNNQMIFYDDDNETPLLTFNLKDSDGNPTELSPYERDPA